MEPTNHPEEDLRPSSKIVLTSAAAKESTMRGERPDAALVREKATTAISIASSATGPRTPHGKNRSKNNATKHGIFSNVVVLQGESRPDYESLLDGLRESFQPVGSLEEILVEKLAALLWRHRRVINAEGAEIRKKREFLEWDKKREQSMEGENQARENAITGLDTFDDGDTREGLIWHIENPEISDRCLELLGELRDQVESEELSLESEGTTSSILTRIYGPPGQKHLTETLYGEYTAWCHTAEAEPEERKHEGYASPEECKKQVLQAIAAETERLKRYKKSLLAIEVQRVEIEKLRQSVPDTPGLDRLMRYEASLERAFDRTLSQLERIQRMRKGQAVPPPLKVDVSA